MIFFVGNDGTIIKSMPSPVYQGAANANNIYLIAPFASNLTATVAFKLPNGLWTERYLMTPVNEISDVINEKTGMNYSGWQFSMPNEITQYYGTVTAQFFFYAAQGNVVASSSTRFIVARGVPEIPTNNPDDNTFDEILKVITGIQSDLSNGYFSARSIRAWNSAYYYGANEIVFYPDMGDYGVFLKSLTDNNNTPPYTDGNLNTENWLLVSDFNILTELYTLKGDIESAVQLSSENADAAGQAASEAANASQNAAQSAQNAEASADRIESQAQYIEGVKDGTIAVPKAVADGTGENIENQFKAVVSDIQGLRDDINNESHFRGMFDSVEALREAYPTATPNDYAYIVGGNQWIYQDGAWTDSNVPSPNTTVPKGTSIPLMDGEGSAGNSSAYASEDHRHPSDTTKADTYGSYPGLSVGTANRLVPGRTIDGLPFDGSKDIDHYAICSTDSSTREKVVDKSGFRLAAGARITVRFMSANDELAPMLNVNNTGAKSIIADSDDQYVKWRAGTIMEFVYNGGDWVVVAGYQLQGKRVGTLYSSNNSTSPATLYGGSWTAIQDRFIVGAGGSYAVGATGGSADAVVVSHNHGERTAINNTSATTLLKLNSSGTAYGYVTTPQSFNEGKGDVLNTYDTGESGAGKNIPPYRAEYIWYRTA